MRDRSAQIDLEQQDKHEAQWATLTSTAEKIGCTAETLHGWSSSTVIGSLCPECGRRFLGPGQAVCSPGCPAARCRQQRELAAVAIRLGDGLRLCVRFGEVPYTTRVTERRVMDRRMFVSAVSLGHLAASLSAGRLHQDTSAGVSRRWASDVDTNGRRQGTQVAGARAHGSQG